MSDETNLTSFSASSLMRLSSSLPGLLLLLQQNKKAHSLHCNSMVPRGTTASSSATVSSQPPIVPPVVVVRTQHDPQLQSLQRASLEASQALHSIARNKKQSSTSITTSTALHASTANTAKDSSDHESDADDGPLTSSTCRGGGSAGNDVSSSSRINQRSTRLQRFLQGTLPKLAPSFLLACTAIVYTAVVRHPKCILTTPAIVSMLLLAFQTSLQPRLSRAYLSESTLSKQTIALIEEVVKTVLAMGLYALNRQKDTQTVHWTLLSSLFVAALPAALYAVQGVLTYTAYPHLDAVTFNGLSQTKTVSAAIFCYLVLGQTQTPRQMLSIGILVTSAIVFNKKCMFLSNNNNDIDKQSQQRSLEWWGKGVIPCLCATAVSGLAGAFSQRGLQVVHRDPYLFTIEVSAYSALTLLISMTMTSVTKKNQATIAAAPSSKTARPSDDKNAPIRRGLRANVSSWDSRILIPIAFKAVGGILTALVHKHAGSVLKGFALVLGLVFSGLFQTSVDQKELSIPQVAGTILVLFSSWMHFTPES